VKAVVETVEVSGKSLGHKVEEAQPDVNGKGVAMSYLTMCFGEVAGGFRRHENLAGKGDQHPLTWRP